MAFNQKASVTQTVLSVQWIQMICPGESWLGLETLHQLTSEANYSLHITLKDFDDKTYVAVYDQIQVIMT